MSNPVRYKDKKPEKEGHYLYWATADSNAIMAYWRPDLGCFINDGHSLSVPFAHQFLSEGGACSIPADRETLEKEIEKIIASNEDTIDKLKHLGVCAEPQKEFVKSLRKAIIKAKTL